MEVHLVIKYIIMTIIGTVLTLIIVPFLLFFIIIFGIICLFAQAAIKLKYGDTAYKATATDVIHGKWTKHTMPVISIGIKVSGDLNISNLRTKLYDTITKIYNVNGERRYKRFMEKYQKKFGYNIWRKMPEEDFHIEDHVRVIDLKELQAKYEARKSPKHFGESEILSGENTRCDWMVVMKMMLEVSDMKPFPENKPPWEMLVVKDGPDSFSILYRYHHAISDGIYLMRSFYEDQLDEPFYMFNQNQPSHHFVRILRNMWSFSLLPFGLWTILSHNDRNPLHGPTLSGRKRYFMSSRIASDTIRTIKSVCPFKVTSHDIIFSCVSFAISKHFSKRGSQVAKITAVTPIPLQNKMGEIKLKNNFALGVINNFPVPLITKPYDEDFPALNRLRLVKKCFEEMHKDASILPLNGLVNLACAILPSAVCEAILSTKGCTLAISRLPGAEKELKVYGGVLKEHAFWVPDREPVGVGFGIFTYNGYLRITLAIDEIFIASEDEGESMMEDFEVELHELLREVQKQGDKITKDKQNILEFVKSKP